MPDDQGHVKHLFKFRLVLLSFIFINTVPKHVRQIQHVLIFLLFLKSSVEFEQSTGSYGSPVGFYNMSVFKKTNKRKTKKEVKRYQ